MGRRDGGSPGKEDGEVFRLGRRVQGRWMEPEAQPNEQSHQGANRRGGEGKLLALLATPKVG